MRVLREAMKLVVGPSQKCDLGFSRKDQGAI